MPKRIVRCAVFLIFLLLVCTWLSDTLYQQGAARSLSGVQISGDDFRGQRLTRSGLALMLRAKRLSGMSAGELLTILLSDAAGSAKPASRWAPDDFVKWKRLMLRCNEDGFRRVSRAYAAVWDDIECFPVASGGITYENSWMFERNYGGKRGHEGTDLMPPENLPGHYRIVSMTDGVVEKIGWLPLGGYRIGIRSPSGGYFYYAHLDSYSRTFRVGEEISAGTVLGLMGDTGYGEEGTRGQFDVHLHLGIYIRTEENEELSVNPYWVLRCAQAEEESRRAEARLPLRQNPAKGSVASFAGIC